MLKDVPLVLGKGYNKTDSTYNYLVVATPPEEHHVQYKFGPGAQITPYTIKVPWLIWSMTLREWNNQILLNHMCVFMIKHNPLDLNEELYCLPLPNIDNGGYICLGHDKVKPLPQNISVQRVVNELITAFWGGTFNSDFAIFMLIAFDLSTADLDATVGFEKWQESFSNVPWYKFSNATPSTIGTLKEHLGIPGHFPLPLMDPCFAKENAFQI